MGWVGGGVCVWGGMGSGKGNTFKDSDQPVFAQSDENLHSVHFVWIRMQSFFMQRSRTDQTAQIDAQVDLSLCWAHMSKDTVSYSGSLYIFVVTIFDLITVACA